MKICVTSQGESMDSEVDPRFGRCAYFIMVDTETMESESIMNGSAGAGGGAGVQAAQVVANMGAELVITGNIGPKAFQALDAADIKVIADVGGTVKKAVDDFIAGELKGAVSGPTAPRHAGISRGRRE